MSHFTSSLSHLWESGMMDTSRLHASGRCRIHPDHHKVWPAVPIKIANHVTHPKTAHLAEGFWGLQAESPGPRASEEVHTTEIGHLQKLRMVISVGIQKDRGKDKSVAGLIQTAGGQTFLETAIA
jgi:hypothetical protein